MKKLFIIAIALLSLGSVAVSASQLVKDANITVLDDEKEKVKLEDTPQAVQDALKAAEYADATIESIYLVKASPEYYSVDMKKGEQKFTVNLDKDGKKVVK
ncbi:MAG TPA: hypothetical protein VHO72_08025 [Bacteroidales bacterium]|nr:hypothetical protein [Bacteroidales bacterium]